jgi:hypothetical protein
MTLRIFGQLAAPITLALGVALFSTGAAAQPADAPNTGQPAAEAPSAEAAAPVDDSVARLTGWVAATRDNNGAPFIVIDKVAAKVLVFSPTGELVGATPALLGIAHGDDSAPGVGTKKLSAIRHQDRTTPAGRFVAKIGMASGNHEVLWVDYGNAISLHPVVTANKAERRVQRLQSDTPKDNRITFGCINVPASFYKSVVRPLFGKGSGIVYILPETKALNETFPGIHET